MSALAVALIVIEAFVILVLLVKLRRPKYDGNMVVQDLDEKKIYSLEIETDPDALDKKRQIVLKVVDTPQ